MRECSEDFCHAKNIWLCGANLHFWGYLGILSVQKSPKSSPLAPLVRVGFSISVLARARAEKKCVRERVSFDLSYFWTFSAKEESPFRIGCGGNSILNRRFLLQAEETI